MVESFLSLRCALNIKNKYLWVSCVCVSHAWFHEFLLPHGEVFGPFTTSWSCSCIIMLMSPLVVNLLIKYLLILYWLLFLVVMCDITSAVACTMLWLAGVLMTFFTFGDDVCSTISNSPTDKMKEACESTTQHRAEPWTRTQANRTKTLEPGWVEKKTRRCCGARGQRSSCFSCYVFWGVPISSSADMISFFILIGLFVQRTRLRMAAAAMVLMVVVVMVLILWW